MANNWWDDPSVWKPPVGDGASSGNWWDDPSVWVAPPSQGPTTRGGARGEDANLPRSAVEENLLRRAVTASQRGVPVEKLAPLLQSEMAKRGLVAPGQTAPEVPLTDDGLGPDAFAELHGQAGSRARGGQPRAGAVGTETNPISAPADSSLNDAEFFQAQPVGAFVRRADGSVQRRDTTLTESVLGGLARAAGQVRTGLMNTAPTLTADKAAQIVAAERIGGYQVETPDGLGYWQPVSARDVAEAKQVLGQSATQIARNTVAGNAIGDAIPRSLARQRFEADMQTGTGLGAALGNIARSPGQALATASESLLSQAPAIVVGALSKNPMLAGAIAGLNSGQAEYASAIADYMGQHGVDIRDEQAVAGLSPQFMQDALSYAHTRAGIIAPIDAVTGGAVSKMLIPSSLVKNVGRREAANLLAQTAGDAGLGMAGELAAQQATGQKKDFNQVLLEGVGELVAKPVEIAPHILDRARIAADPTHASTEELHQIATAADTPHDRRLASLMELASRGEAPPPNAAPATPAEAGTQAADALLAQAKASKSPIVPEPAAADVMPSATIPEPESPSAQPALSPDEQLLQRLQAREPAFDARQPAPESAPPPPGDTETTPAPIAPSAVSRESLPTAPANAAASVLDETGVQRLAALGQQRRQAPLPPAEAEEYQSLLEADRHAGKVGGRVMPGIRNLTAYREAEQAGQLQPAQAFMDLDNFKAVNDTYGHAMGDEVIAQLGAVLRDAAGDGNVFHRSGDEFTIQGASPEAVQQAAERARQNLATTRFRVTLDDGSVRELTGAAFSYGVGPTITEAEHAQAQDKQARAAAGLRTERSATDRRNVAPPGRPTDELAGGDAGAGPAGPEDRAPGRVAPVTPFGQAAEAVARGQSVEEALTPLADTQVQAVARALGQKFKPSITRAGLIGRLSTQPEALPSALQSLDVPPREAANDRRSSPSGIPANLPATKTPATQRLARAINRQLAADGRARVPARFRAVDETALPDPLRGALSALNAFGNLKTVIVRNLNPTESGVDFNGVTLRDGTLFVDETAQHPVTTVAAHEFSHQLERDRPELYRLLADEVRRQGKLPEFAANLAKRGEAPGREVSELVGDAVGDALTDRGFLETLAQRNPSKFRQLADRFIAFLDSLLGRLRDTGSAAYLRDVQAFRNVLADVLEQFTPTDRNPAPKQTPPAKPRDLLQVVARAGGLNRAAWRAVGIDPTEMTRRAGFHFIFRKQGGMTPSGLREFMQQEGYLPPDPLDAPPEVDDNEAIDLFDRAFRGGEQIFSADQGGDVAAYREAQRAADEAYRQELEGQPDIGPVEPFLAQHGDQLKAVSDLTEQAHDLGASDDEILAAAFEARDDADHRDRLLQLIQEFDHAPDEPGPTLGDRQGFLESRQADQPTARPSPAQTGLFAGPTARETLAAENARRTAERNGLGRDLVRPEQGAGDLLAGPRPDQSDIDSPSFQARTPDQTETPEATFQKRTPQDAEAAPDLAVGGGGAAVTERTQAQASPEATNAVPEETSLQAARRIGQDKFNRFKVLQEHIELQAARGAGYTGSNIHDARDYLVAQGVPNPITDATDVYQAETTMSGKIAARAQDFRELQMQPLIRETQAAGVSMQQVADYLKMQHAPEANTRARKIHKDDNATAFGVTDAEAKQAVAAFDKNQPGLKAIANRWRGITEQTKKILLDSGILDQDAVQAWEDTYSFYVPVKGAETSQPGPGKGLSVNGKTKQRMGHGLRDEAILENILRDHERAIAQDEHNQVGKTLLRFGLEIQNDAIMTIDKPVKRQVLDDGVAYEVAVDGAPLRSFAALKDARAFMALDALKTKRDPKAYTIERSTDPHVVLQASPLLAENEVNVYVGGQAVRIQLNDPIAARAYTNLGVEGLNGVLSGAREVNNFLSKAYTGYSPDFLLRNPIRDAIQGSATLTGELGAVGMAKTFAAYPHAAKELVKHFLHPGSSALVTAYRANGGSTGASYLSDLERINANLMAAYNEYAGVMDTYRRVFQKARSEGKSVAKATAKATAQSGLAGLSRTPILGHFLALMEHLNAVTENALRVATFQTAQTLKDPVTGQNYTPAKAAALAKNLMNFNRRGEIANQMGALYLFFNPSIQGTDVLINTLGNSRHRNQARTLAGLMVLAGYGLAELGRASCEKHWKETPDGVKNRNLMLCFAGYQFTLPVPYGYGVFHALGNALSDYQHGRDGWEIGLSLTSTLFDNFSPFGNPLEGEHGPFQLIPTLPKMALGPSVNEDSFGRPIVPQRFNEAKPDAQLMNRRTKGTVADQAAQTLNELTGGSKYERGAIDVSPETLKFWVSSLTGGAGKFAVDAINAPITLSQGVIPDVRDVPIARVFVREPGISDTRAAYWDKAQQAQEFADSFAAAVRAKDPEGLRHLVFKGVDMSDDAQVRAKRMQAGALLLLAKVVDKQQVMVKALRDEQDRLRQDDTLTLPQKDKRMKAMEVREQRVYDAFLRAFDNTQKKD